jgi:hypothetical protein
MHRTSPQVDNHRDRSEGVVIAIGIANDDGFTPLESPPG